MITDRRGLRFLVPGSQILAPQLALQGPRARFQALGDLRMVMHKLVPDVLRRMTERVFQRTDRPRAGVGKSVDELQIDVVKEKPVAPQGFPEPASELLGVHLCHEAGHRSRPVNVIEEPGSWPGGLELPFLRDTHRCFSYLSAWQFRPVHASRSHDYSSSSLLDRLVNSCMLFGFLRSSVMRTLIAHARASPACSGPKEARQAHRRDRLPGGTQTPPTAAP